MQCSISNATHSNENLQKVTFCFEQPSKKALLFRHIIIKCKLRVEPIPFTNWLHMNIRSSLNNETFSSYKCELNIVSISCMGTDDAKQKVTFSVPGLRGIFGLCLHMMTFNQTWYKTLISTYFSVQVSLKILVDDEKYKRTEKRISIWHDPNISSHSRWQRKWSETDN